VADSKPKSGSPPAPSFYSAAAGMDGNKQGTGAGGASTPAGQSGEKVKNVETLLEVFAKMDKLEDDPDGKAMIQSMVDQAKKYLDKLKGVKSDKPTSQPATGEAGSGGMGDGGAGAPVPAAGGAGGAGGGPPGMAA
jgi:hypothetical protein